MPYTLPTVEQFQERFPVYADASEEQIAALIAEASGQVDDSWLEQDYQPAVMYLAAHLLATDSSQEGETAGAGGDGQVVSESFNGMSVSYARPAGAGISASYNSDYATTSYGRRYLNLLKKNKPAIVSI